MRILASFSALPLTLACTSPARTLEIPDDPSRITFPMAIIEAASAYYCHVGTWPAAFREIEPVLEQAGVLDQVTPSVVDEYRASTFKLEPSGSLGIYRHRPPDQDPPVNWAVEIPESCSRFKQRDKPAA